MQQKFLLQNLLFAQHVSGTTMPIIGSSRLIYGGCCLWYFMLWFSSCWSGVELRVMCPVCRMLQHPANRTHNPQLKSNLNWVPYTEHKIIKYLVPQSTNEAHFISIYHTLHWNLIIISEVWDMERQMGGLTWSPSCV